MRRLPLGLGLGLALLASPAAAFDIDAPGREPKDLTLQVRSPFSAIPGSGYLPVQVELTNDAPVPRRVSIRTEAEAMRGAYGARVTRRTVEVPAKSRRTYDVLAPLPSSLEQMAAWRTIEIVVEGGGLGPCRGSMSGRSPHTNGRAQPTLGFGPLLPDGATALEGAVVGEIHAVDVDLELLSADPRALLGLDALFLTPAAIVSMPEPARRAVQGYVGQGGRLVVIDIGLEPASVLRRLFSDAAWTRGRFGLGRLFVVSEAVSTATGDRAVEQMREAALGSLATRVVVSGIEARVPGLATQGELQLAAPEVELHAGGIAAFLCAFVVLVGPLNLLVFAPRARRTRLLWTTPAISVGASALLAAGILLQDGVGGSGERRTLRVLQPEARLEHRFQVQVSRTGLVPFGGFELDPAVHIEPVPPAPQDVDRLEQSGPRASGDWFPTRAVQAYLLQRTAPSRQRIGVRTDADGTPTLTSELAAPLAPVFYQDGEARMWRAASLAPGAQVELTLVESQGEAFDWLSARAALFPGHLRREVERVSYGAGVVFGEAAAAEAWDTHGSLRWTDGPGLVLVETGPAEVSR